jgi:predicted ArsR family transcriptional regulator
MPQSNDILNCLKKHGERLDSEIAEEIGMPLAAVRQGLAGLATTGLVVKCNLTRFEGGRRIEGWLCRVSGYIPPAAPGRKPNPPA